MLIIPTPTYLLTCIHTYMYTRTRTHVHTHHTHAAGTGLILAGDFEAKPDEWHTVAITVSVSAPNRHTYKLHSRHLLTSKPSKADHMSHFYALLASLWLVSYLAPTHPCYSYCAITKGTFHICTIIVTRKGRGW